jgi:hypothetical protein
VDEQAAALAYCAQHSFVNLSGTAGVGKTWVARQLADDPGTVLCATTGIAAVNLGEGTTINALLRYYDTDSMKQAFLGGFLDAQLRKLRRSGVRRIVLDEKSMLNGEQLTYLVRAIQSVNGTRSYDASLEGSDDTDEIALVLVGDFGQLPPVPDKDPLTLKNKPVAFAFESPEWALFADHGITLSQVRRQDARDFVQALHQVRLASREALGFFTPDRFSLVLDDAFDGTTIFAKNEAVDRYNQLRLDRLQGTPMVATAVRTGKPRGDWKLIPDQLTLKEGALVMILANKRVYLNPPVRQEAWEEREAEEDNDLGELIYCNGDLGTLVGAGSGGWHVQLQRTGGVVSVSSITRENTIPLEPGRKKELRATYGDAWVSHVTEEGKGRNEIIGTITYMPLRAAYGCTVHKTQGLTLDRVQVNIRDPFFRSPGMLFVALSRARTAEGLRIIGTQAGLVERLTVNPKVRPWL